MSWRIPRPRGGAHCSTTPIAGRPVAEPAYHPSAISASIGHDAARVVIVAIGMVKQHQLEVPTVPTTITQPTQRSPQGRSLHQPTSRHLQSLLPWQASPQHDKQRWRRERRQEKHPHFLSESFQEGSMMELLSNWPTNRLTTMIISYMRSTTDLSISMEEVGTWQSSTPISLSLNKWWRSQFLVSLRCSN